MDHIKIKFKKNNKTLLFKDTVKKMKRKATDWETSCKIYIYKVLVFNIYKEHLELKNKETNNTIKNMQNIRADT